MAAGEERFLLRTGLSEFVLTVRWLFPVPKPDQGQRSRSALTELDLALGASPDVDATLREVARALGNDEPLTESQLLELLERAERGGKLLVEKRSMPSLTDRRELTFPELPPLPPAPRESKGTDFEVRLVDEVGQAISGVDAELFATGSGPVRTNAAGIARLDGVESDSATVSLLDVDGAARVLDPRWEKRRPGAPPKESNTFEAVFRGGKLGPYPLKPAVPNTLVLRPPLGKLFVELLDKSGRVRHAQRPFRISGPESFEGETDEDGRLLQTDVFPGNYTLSLTLDFFEGDSDAVTEVVESPLVVLEPFVGAPQVRRLGVVPHSVLAQLKLFFNTNKAFLLPTALPSVLKLRKLYTELAPCKLLVVGHADTRGGKKLNDKLSLQRANSIIAYLKDDVDAWLAFYDEQDTTIRWGKSEDHLMLISLPDFETKPKGEPEVSWFQRTRKLKVDGTAGKETRTQLIGEYMAQDGTSLQDFAGEIEAVAHGAGESFPLAEDGKELDPQPGDERADPNDRRVELFFFDREFGITPPPPGETSTSDSPEYPKWRERVAEVVALAAGDPEAAKLTFVELSDAHFRTNSAVVLPEGEAPDASGEHPAITSVGLIAAALRFNDEHPERSILVAGHTDTAASEGFNQKLSEERARVALALLEGGSEGRDNFAKLCNARHTTEDIQQILSWIARAFSFNCDPGKIDGVARKPPVENFQRAYNANRATLNPDPNVANLNPDGTVGELTWGAFFDCYEAALRDELGEDAAGVAALRAELVFADEERKSLGFGELFPIEELGVDEFRSQSNRRVELLFFEPGEEPDLEHAEDDPETSELYLPGRFDRTALPPTATAKRPNELDIHVRDPSGVLSTLRLVTDGGFEQIRTTETAEPDDDDPTLSRVRFEKLPDLGLFSLFMRNAERPELILFAELPFAALAGAAAAPLSVTPNEDILAESAEPEDFDPDSYLNDYLT